MTITEIEKETYDEMRLDLLQEDNDKTVAAHEARVHGYEELAEILYAEREPIRANLKAVEECLSYMMYTKEKRHLYPNRPAPSKETQQIVFDLLKAYNY